jgi:hypothetical protein
VAIIRDSKKIKNKQLFLGDFFPSVETNSVPHRRAVDVSWAIKHGIASNLMGDGCLTANRLFSANFAFASSASNRLRHKFFSFDFPKPNNCGKIDSILQILSPFFVSDGHGKSDFLYESTVQKRQTRLERGRIFDFAKATSGGTCQG